MLTLHDHGNLIDVIPDEPVNPPAGLLVREEELLISKEADLVGNDSLFGVEPASPDYHAVLPLLLTRELSYLNYIRFQPKFSCAKS